MEINIGLVALGVLFVIIVLAFAKKLHVGLLAISAATVLGLIADISTSTIISGFSSSLFLTLFGITLLLGAIQSTGVLEHLVRHIVGRFSKYIWSIPIVIYIVGYVLSAVGPGCIPAVAVIVSISLPIAKVTGYSPIMLMFIGNTATYAGRWTPITPEGILVIDLMGAQDIMGVTVPLMINSTLITIMMSVIFYVAYKGYNVQAGIESKDLGGEEPFTHKEIIALLGLVVFILLLLVLAMNTGLAAFLVSSVLIVSGVADEKVSLKAVPLNTLMLLTGVGVLMNIVITTGGIDILANALATLMTPLTATAIFATTAGMMSWFSSTMGVVLPTLLPTISRITETVSGANALEMMSVAATVSSFAGFSPASSIGAMMMATCAGDPVYQSIDQSKMFREMFLWSAFAVALPALISLTGLFRLFI